MKKFLLSAGLFSLVLVGRAQTILNELYVEPSPSTNEFFELYYSGTLPIGDNVNCWTMVTYWSTDTSEGWYVLDLPNVTTGFTNRYMVGASSDPFTAQGSTNVSPDFNWNNMDATGKMTKWTRNGSGYTNTTSEIPSNFDDFFYNKGGGGFNYAVMVFVNGVFSNGFLGGSNASTSTIITTMPDLTLTTADANVCADFTIDFSTLGAFENVNQAAGSDNGYRRTADGQCGSWTKSSSSAQHTPGSSNGVATVTGSLTTAEFISCQVPPAARYVSFDITGFTGAVNLADDFPVIVQAYNDVNHNGLDAPDVFIGQKSIATDVGPGDTIQLVGSNQNADVILIYKTKRGCFDKVVRIINECAPLPVNFKSFTAVRTSGTMVELKWITITEEFSKGFIVERNTGTGWVEIVFIPSQAINGNSTDQLTYHYSDLNSAKGITQYRIRQVDIDNTSRLSQIRAVRGEGQTIKTNVFPNPTNDGKVTVVFVDGNATRDITLMDMSGRVVAQMKGVTNNNIQLENLNPGMYSLRIVDRGTGMQAVEKIVVNKR